MQQGIIATNAGFYAPQGRHLRTQKVVDSDNHHLSQFKYNIADHQFRYGNCRSGLSVFWDIRPFRFCHSRNRINAHSKKSRSAVHD